MNFCSECKHQSAGLLCTNLTTIAAAIGNGALTERERATALASGNTYCSLIRKSESCLGFEEKEAAQ